jgi:hypothetical protein
MAKLAASSTARWFDPTSGTYTAISGSPFSNVGTQQFTSPATIHADGTNDWVLAFQSP